jgi:hypothetical protein
MKLFPVFLSLSFCFTINAMQTASTKEIPAEPMQKLWFFINFPEKRGMFQPSECSNSTVSNYAIWRKLLDEVK